MHILDKITDQVSAIGLPLYAVTLTAVPRYDTPLLLMLHWHGFRRELVVNLPGISMSAGSHWKTSNARCLMPPGKWAPGILNARRGVPATMSALRSAKPSNAYRPLARIRCMRRKRCMS